MERSKDRGRWGGPQQEIQMPLSVPSSKEEIPPQYEHYLRLLQERNRLMKKLRQKDGKQIEIEKKEKGFTLYLNTSFSEEKLAKDKLQKRHQPRRAKTSGGADSSFRASQNKQSAQGSSKSISGGLARERRRNWQIGSVEFTTADGQRQKVKAPEILSGRYKEDFEYSSSDDDSSKVSESMSNNGDDDDDLSASQSSLNTPRRHKTSYLKRVVAAQKEEIEMENRITITMEDVKKLRASLQMNSSIRESLALGVDSDIEEDLPLDYEKDNSDGERISPINEEEIEEMISSDENAEDDSVKPLTLMKPGDTLVLEFQPLQTRHKSGQLLSAVRRKSSNVQAPGTPSSSAKQPLSSPSSAYLNKNGSSKVCGTSSRPLSANRKSSDSKTDPHYEASAVIKALQAENKKAELFSKVSRPLPQPKNPSGAKVPSSRSPEKTSAPNAVKSNADPGVSKSGSARSSFKNSAEVNADGNNIDNVINRVMKMNAKQQKDLLQTLNHIDTEKESHPVMSKRALITSSWSSKAPVTDRLEVTLEILSNWGHKSLVGLTELQFYDKSGCLVPIKPSDVSVHGAKDSSNPVDVLFNGKSKTTKERNMWSCRFDGRPVEFSILLINPSPGKAFQFGAIKIWNWNNKISNLDVGARNVRMFFGGELLFNGEVDKGCGNQVFDYSKHILFSSPNSNSSSTQASKSLSKQDLSLNISASNSQTTRGLGQIATSPTKGLTPPSKGNHTPGSHHIFRSISRSSQSSASSSGSLPSASRARAGSEERVEERPSSRERSETRTLIRPAILKRRGSGSGSSPDVEAAGDISVMPEKKRAQTPLKTKRVAAKLNGRSSETDNSSKSNADSYESKPPLPPAVNKSDEKLTSKSSQLSNMKPKPSPKSSKSEPQVSPRISPSLPASSVSGAKSTSEIDGSKEKRSLVDEMKALNVSENKRKKDIPKWLKKESGNAKDSSNEDMLQKQLDEEFEKFSRSGKEDISNADKSNADKSNAVKATEEEKDILTPMKKIEKSRAKWRTKEEDLEESWGSLSYFNKSQRGRLSIDMTDDTLDEYLSSASKKKTSEETPKLALPDDTWEDEDADDFLIPELPSGRELVINIKTTWGDHHYVGLTGVQLFSSDGQAVIISKIWAIPSDINILSEYTRDPRVVSNVIDNVNRTRDDVHMWLAPFTSGNNHLVYMTFAKPCKIALMRIWNYNKSRIHSFRGAKDVVITLDGTEIFKGEIARACGGIEGGTEAFGDTILFTTDEGILESVSKNDDSFEGEMFNGEQEELPSERPSTADAEDDTRPFTRASGTLPSKDAKEEKPRPGTSFITYSGDVLVFKTNTLELLFTATWGDHHYMGLTGLEVVGKEGESIPVNMSIISAKPEDLRHLQGNDKDERTLDKLIDGVNVTSHDSHMWLIPFTEGENHSVSIQFPAQTLVTGVRIWNYNKSPEDTYRGAKVMHVKINNRMISPLEGYLLRKGPGVCHFDFAQEVSFSNPPQSQETDKYISSGDNNTCNSNLVQMPRGFIFQLQIFSTWGDQYYAGLNGLEFYDLAFNKIELTQNNISAYPDSVNVLDNVNNDARTPDKLIDGINETSDGRHMWLAPVLPGIINRVYVIFDQPTTISMIKLWNYSKTVNRGVKDFALLVDDLLVYNGTLQAVSGGAKGILPNCSASIPHHTVLFSDNKDIARKERNAIISNQTEDQDIQLLNDKQIVSKFSNSSSKKPVNQALRPKTSVTKMARR